MQKASKVNGTNDKLANFVPLQWHPYMLLTFIWSQVSVHRLNKGICESEIDGHCSSDKPFVACSVTLFWLGRRGVFKITSSNRKPVKRKNRAVTEALLLATSWNVSMVHDHAFSFDLSSYLVSYCGCHSDLIFVLNQEIWLLSQWLYILFLALPSMLWVSHIIIHKYMCAVDAFCCMVKAMPPCCFICRDSLWVSFQFCRAKSGIMYLRWIKGFLWHNNQSA